MIGEFKNEARWLSNFAPVEIKLDGLTFPSVEHAYMSAKSTDENWKKFCANKDNRAWEVKKESKNIVLIDDWELIKLEVMAECVKQKFSQEPYKTKLLETELQHIEEGNMWGDKFWGVCLKTFEGENHLGMLIMKFRSTINDINLFI